MVIWAGVAQGWRAPRGSHLLRCKETHVGQLARGGSSSAIVLGRLGRCLLPFRRQLPVQLLVVALEPLVPSAQRQHLCSATWKGGGEAGRLK